MGFHHNKHEMRYSPKELLKHWRVTVITVLPHLLTTDQNLNTDCYYKCVFRD